MSQMRHLFIQLSNNTDYCVRNEDDEEMIPAYK